MPSSIWQHALSRLVGWAARQRWWPLKHLLISIFMRIYSPDLGDAAEPRASRYASFNLFFTRALRAGVRPMEGEENTLVSPVDGRISQFGALGSGELLQAKGHHYSLGDLLGAAAAQWAPAFLNGQFITVYLAPTDYHRIHMPLTGTLREAWYIPGSLFPVNEKAVQSVARLFARNERIVLLFETAQGPMGLVFVGALNVGSMGTVWHGDVLPTRPRQIRSLPIPAASSLVRGAEVGRFNLGSTVIVLLGAQATRLSATLKTGDAVRMGQQLGTTRP